MTPAIRSRGIAWAGLALGPGAWLVNTQANLAAVPWVCAHRVHLIPALAVVLAAVAIAGAVLSWFSFRTTAASDVAQGAGGKPRHFLASMSVFMGILFALVILTQGAAALVLTGCER